MAERSQFKLYHARFSQGKRKTLAISRKVVWAVFRSFDLDDSPCRTTDRPGVSSGGASDRPDRRRSTAPVRPPPAVYGPPEDRPEMVRRPGSIPDGRPGHP